MRKSRRTRVSSWVKQVVEFFSRDNKLHDGGIDAGIALPRGSSYYWTSRCHSTLSFIFPTLPLQVAGYVRATSIERNYMVKQRGCVLLSGSWIMF